MSKNKNKPQRLRDAVLNELGDLENAGFDKGTSYGKVALKYGVKGSTIKQWVHRYGIPNAGYKYYNGKLTPVTSGYTPVTQNTAPVTQMNSPVTQNTTPVTSPVTSAKATSEQIKSELVAAFPPKASDVYQAKQYILKHIGIPENIDSAAEYMAAFELATKKLGKPILCKDGTYLYF